MNTETVTDYNVLLNLVSEGLKIQQEFTFQIPAILELSEEIAVLREFAEVVSEEESCQRSVTLS